MYCPSPACHTSTRDQESVLAKSAAFKSRPTDKGWACTMCMRRLVLLHELVRIHERQVLANVNRAHVEANQARCRCS